MKENVVDFKPNKFEFYDLFGYSQHKGNYKIYSPKKEKENTNYNFVLIIADLILLTQTILIGQKLDGSLMQTSWFLIFLPLILGIFVFCLSFCIIFTEEVCGSIAIFSLVISFCYPIIFSVAAKLEGKITARYVSI